MAMSSYNMKPAIGMPQQNMQQKDKYKQGKTYQLINQACKHRFHHGFEP